MGMEILAADIGGTYTKLCLCDQQGNLRQFQEFETESSKGGPHVIHRLLDKMAEYEGYDAIAISTAGQVNPEEGCIIYANENIPDYTGMKVREMIEARLGRPVKVENDVNAAALGEAYFGAAQSFSDFLCLTYGTGIGGAIVIDRRIYRGAKGCSAEFGHMFTHPLSERQEGERKPYYEHFASTTALVRNAMSVDPGCINGKIMFDKLAERNEALNQVLQAWTDEVAAGLASLIHIFNPGAIIIGGGVMEQTSLVQLVEEKTKGLVMKSFADVQILKASLGNKAGVLGAASLFLR